MTEITYCTRNEAWILDAIEDELQSGDVFWDVGANIGIYSLLAGTNSADVSVVSFEPYPPNAASLRRNLDYNDISATVVEKALGDTRGTIGFDITSEEGVDGSAAVDSGAESPCEVVPGDSLVHDDGIAPPDVLKIDVEGAELDVLDGLAETLSSGNCRTIYCEVHLSSSDRPSIEDFGGSFDELKRTLRTHGYELSITDRDNEKHVLARRSQ